MNNEFITKWCENLKNAWINKDYDAIATIFSKTKTYYEDPFSEPGENINQIISFWEEIKYQNIQELNIIPIAIDNKRVIMRWFLNYEDCRDSTVVIMDGIYLADFNENMDCVNFIQWWVMKE